VKDPLHGATDMTHAESAERVIANLSELRALTSTERGAQRVAWGPVWRKAREWFKGKVAALGLSSWTDSAGNLWVKVEGERPESVILGSHLDSVPSGGWLDGCLGVVAGLEVLARWVEAKERPPVTLYCVDWADEEGARFGRSLVGSAASAGALDPQKELAHLVDRNGIKCPDAMKEDGVLLAEMMRAHEEFKALSGKAYLELHIEQGPVLEAMKKPTGVVLGTMGVDRYMLRFKGQAAHAGATPIPLRQDAFLAAAEFALACREIGLAHSGKTPKTRVVATCGVVKVEPNFVTAISGAAEISIDLRALDGKVLAKMTKAALAAGQKAAKRNKCTVDVKPLLRIEPRPFDEALLALARKAVKKAAGSAPEIPSGPLHDASEMAGVMPTVMIFAQSSPGISHCKEEDTPLPALRTSIRAFLDLAEQVVGVVAQ
jgi:N-carbamoyl-L-amino-acid hydrolase